MLRATDRSGRLVGVDVARFLALAGMAATHVFPAFGADGSLHPAFAVAAGRAAALFAVLAGASLALSTGARTPPRGRTLRAARAGVLARAGMLVALGFLLSSVESPPLVILAYYGLLFLIATAFLGWRTRALAIGAAAAATLMPVASHLLRQHLAVAPVDEPFGEVVERLLVTGTYPALTWSAYLLAGLAVGRSDLRRISTAVRLLVLGTGLAVAAKALSAVLLHAAGGAARLRGYPGDVDQALARGLFGVTPREDWHWLTVAAPHSGTTLDLAHTTGTSLAVLGACLLLVRLLPARALLPIAAAGSMTLTLYTAHVLALADGSPLTLDDPLALWLLHVGAALVVAAAWRRTVGRGPLEWVSSRLDHAARDAVTGGHRSRAATR